VGRRFHEDRVELLLFQHVAVVLVFPPFVATRHLLGGFVDAPKVTIGGGDEVGAGQASFLRIHLARPPSPINPICRRSFGPGRRLAPRTSGATTIASRGLPQRRRNGGGIRVFS